MPLDAPAWPVCRFRFRILDSELQLDPTPAFRVSFNFGSEIRFQSLMQGRREAVTFARHGVLLLRGALTPVLRRLEGHAFGPRADGKRLFAKMLLLDVHPDIFEAAARALAWPAGALDEIDGLTFVMDPVALGLAEALRAALTGDEQPRVLLAPIAEAMARWLLLQRDRAIAPTELQHRERSPRNRDALMRRVLERIEAELDQKLSLQSLADGAGMSRSHFLRAFKQGTGMTPHQYVVQARVCRAQRLMQAAVDAGRDVRLSVVAHDAGFASHSQFSAVFRERVGVSPSDWLDHVQRSRARATARSE